MIFFYFVRIVSLLRKSPLNTKKWTIFHMASQWRMNVILWNSIEEFITFLSPNMDYPRFKIKSLKSIDILEHRAFIKYCMQARKSPIRPKGCYMLLEIANKWLGQWLLIKSDVYRWKDWYVEILLNPHALQYSPDFAPMGFALSKLCTYYYDRYKRLFN